jgi:hypothetical protein
VNHKGGRGVVAFLPINLISRTLILFYFIFIFFKYLFKRMGHACVFASGQIVDRLAHERNPVGLFLLVLAREVEIFVVTPQHKAKLFSCYIYIVWL